MLPMQAKHMRDSWFLGPLWFACAVLIFGTVPLTPVHADSLGLVSATLWNQANLGVSLLSDPREEHPLSVISLPHLNGRSNTPVTAVSLGVVPAVDQYGGAAGLILPTPVGVVTGALGFAADPEGFVSRVTTGIARPVGSRLSGGVSASLITTQFNDSLSSGILLDAGAQYQYGIFTLHGGILSVGYSPARGSTAPLFAPITPFAGVSAAVVETEPVRIRVAGALYAPSAQSLAVELGGAMVFENGLSVTLGVRETFDSTETALWPGLAVGVSLPVPRQVSATVQPRRGTGALYGAEAVFTLPRTDLTAPEVTITAPGTTGTDVVLSPGGTVPQLPVTILGRDDRQMGTLHVRLRDAHTTLQEWTFAARETVVPEGTFMERVSMDLWNRTLSGEILIDLLSRDPLPDGTYQLEATAIDTAGNRSTPGVLEFRVDTASPTLRAEFQTIQREQEIRGEIFAQDSTTARETLPPVIELAAEEDLRVALTWDRAERLSVTVEDEGGRPVMPLQVLPTVSAAGTGTAGEEEAQFEIFWPGVGPDQLRVQEGIYRITAEAVDAAGNRSTLTSPPVLVRRQEPRFSLRMEDTIVAPTGDGNRDTLRVIPQLEPLVGLEEWELLLVSLDDEDRAPRSVMSGIDLPPAEIILTGDLLGVDGVYRLDAISRYRNGAVARTQTEPFEVQTVAPAAQLALEQVRIRPELDASLRVYPETDARAFEGELRLIHRDDPSIPARAIRRWSTIPRRYDYDLLQDDGTPLPPGRYAVELVVRDRAGNQRTSPRQEFTLLPRLEGVGIRPERGVFGPTGNGVHDVLNLLLDGSTLTGVTGSYTITISEVATGEPQRRLSGSLPMSPRVQWDGRNDRGEPVRDGNYVAHLLVDAGAAGTLQDRTSPFAVDTTPPRVGLQRSPEIVSPDGDGNQDQLILQIQVEENTESRLRVRRQGQEIAIRPPAVLTDRVSWTPRSADGEILPDDTYTVLVESVDTAGNRGVSEELTFVVDTRPVSGFVRVSAGAFNPRSGGPGIAFSPVLPVAEGLTQWRIELVPLDRPEDAAISLVSGTRTPPPQEVLWDGRAPGGGALPDGRYAARLRAQYAHGPVVDTQSPAVMVDSSPPDITVTTTPELFSPDGDGRDDLLEFHITAEDASPIGYWILEIFDPRGEFFTDFGGAGAPPSRLRWDGRASNGELVQSAERYTYQLEVGDALGNVAQREGIIRVDVLVEPFGTGYRIRIPSITFPPNSPELILDARTEEGVRNREVIERLVEILGRFPEYEIVVEGHAVNLSGTEREEREELQPLSQQRAAAVRRALIERGIPGRTVSAAGRGGTVPVVDHQDEVNRWKNRRVDFILRR